MVATACWPPLAAVTVVVPTDTPVTSPDPLTDAMADEAELHVTGVESALPLASRGVADSCSDLPTSTAATVGATVIDATVGGPSVDSPPPQATVRQRVATPKSA
jgi:hypothetical protein